MKIKVAIADDHPLMITGLKMLLGKDPEMVLTGAYSNGKELLEGLRISAPDVLILDIHMPGQQGDELAEIIYIRHPGVKILALTNENSIYYVRNMLRKGVRGYILKTASESNLLRAIQKVHKGEQYLENTLMERVQKNLQQAKKDTPPVPVVSEREVEVLRHISQGMTSREIADVIGISKRTIDYYRLSMLTKFGVSNVTALIKKAIQLGYID